ncbi:MAG: NAD-dependent epimerase/dehydratase family protein [Nannocystaceae bacterium]|nr:NAD-dependent epimerase/dehydratase family protein [Myxococcales bacterium]
MTGATGLVGYSIVTALRRRGRPVRALVRDPSRASELLGDVELHAGDVTDRASIDAALDGCEVVYHAAGLPEQWLADASGFDRINVGGTRSMIDAALAAGVARFVYTSTIDVFAGARGQSFDESRIDPSPKGTAYERSKQEADRVVANAVTRGLPAVFLHPGGVYGPGPARSRGTNHFFADLRDRRIPGLVPGGIPVVFAPDVGEGHVLAEEKAAVGDRFILVDRYYTLTELARAVLTALEVSGVSQRRRPPRVLPAPLFRAVSWVGEALARRSGRPPLMPAGQLHFLLSEARPSSRRAREVLGWQPTPLGEGIAHTMRYLDQHGP